MDESDMPAERWLPIVGWEGLYEVSDLGRVRSLSRYYPHPLNPAKYRRTPQVVMKQQTDCLDGYAKVSLTLPKERGRPYRVHQLVARAFLGPRPEGKEVRHLNGDPTDATLSNLVYGTHVENMADMFEHGRHDYARRTHCPLGHVLAEPNLVAAWLRKGRRGCLACNRARSAMPAMRARGQEPDFPAEAHQRYAAIMRDVAA